MWSVIWNSGIVNPMTNLLLLLYDWLGNNFFLALVVFTAFTRILMLPLSIKQQKSMMRTQEMQPQIQAIQKKYRNEPQKMQEEFQRIGYNPTEALMGCLPLLVQMPIFFGLYRAIFYVLASTPQGLYELAERAYDFVNLTDIMPVSNSFLWLNMAQPDPWLLLPILVAGSMYLQQKLLTPPPAPNANPNDPAQSMQRSMLVTMPLMFGFFSLQFPAGLSVYFVVSNIIGIAQGYVMKHMKQNLEAEQAQRRKKQKDIVEQGDTSPAEATESGDTTLPKKGKKKSRKGSAARE
jgi:YidC/Oxa1 family membrane protein insertase